MTLKVVFLLQVLCLIPSCSSSWCSILNDVSNSSDVTLRKVRTVLGALHADAASVPLQWIYSQEQLNDTLGDHQSPLFWPQSLNPYFKVPLGSVSMYGDELLTTLETITRDGSINVTNISWALKRKFGSSESHYQVALKKRKQSDRADYPVEGPWITGCVVKALENIDQGVSPSGSKECRDNDPFFLALPAFLLNLDLDLAEQVASILTQDETTLRYVRAQNIVIKYLIEGGTLDKTGLSGAKLQELVLPLGSKVEEDVKEVFEEKASLRKEIPTLSHNAYRSLIQSEVKKWGQSCKLPGAFKSELAVLMTNTWNPRDVLGLSVFAGGDICGRAIFLGAVLGALDSIPCSDFRENWLDKGIVQDHIKVYS